MQVWKDTMIRLPLLVLSACTLLVASSLAKDGLLDQDEVPYGAASDYLIGRQLLKEGNFAEALGYLHLVYRTHPDVPTVAEDFQEALAAEGYYKDAIGVMDRLVATYPDSLSYLLQRSNLNVQMGDAEAALKDLRTFRDLGGRNPEVIVAEASLLAGQGNLNQALDVYRDGIRLFPKHGDRMYAGMAMLLQRDHQMDAIPELMEEGLKKYPESPDLWLLKVRSLAANGKHSQALTAAREADALLLARKALPDPGEAEAEFEYTPAQIHGAGRLVPESFLVELADFYVQEGEVERALGILKPLSDDGELELAPSLWLARIYLGTGQIEPGRLLVDNILVRWPDSGRAWFLQGKLSEGKENWTDAKVHFEKAVALEPYDPEIRLALLRSMLVGWEKDLVAPNPDAGQIEKRTLVETQAVAALTLVPKESTDGQLILGYAFRTLKDPWRAEACFALAAANPDLRISADTQRSLCFDEMGEPVKARQVLEKLSADFPRHPEVANSLGYFLAEKGEDLDKALLLVQVALDAQPGNGAFLDSMGWTLYRLGRTEAAFDYMIQAVNVLPDDPVILEHLGMVMMELGQLDEAIGMLQRSLAMGGDRVRIEAVLEGIAEKKAAAANPERP